MRHIQVSSTGGPEVLELTEGPQPTPGAGQVLVRVAAAGVNFIDTYQRSGLYPMEFPFIPGMEAAGRVEEVGAGVEGVGPGDVVAWADVQGSYAELAVAPADRVVSVPDGVDAVTAAAAMLQGLTAHYLTHSTFPLGAGDRCLVHAGAGGVGRLLIQYAKARGAEVFTTVGSDEKAAVATAAGADHVINYRTSDFAAAITEIVGERPLTVVSDGVGASTFDAGLDLLSPRGYMVTFGNASGPVPPVAPLTLMAKGSLYLTRPTLGSYIAGNDLQVRAGELFEAIGDGTLDVMVGASFPLGEAPDAHRALEGRATTGKVVLVP